MAQIVFRLDDAQTPSPQLLREPNDTKEVGDRLKQRLLIERQARNG